MNLARLYFHYSGCDLLEHVPPKDGNEVVPLSKFDQLLRSKWDEAMQAGCFRYRLGSLQTRILPGSLKMVAQLNIDRAVLRRKPQIISHVNQPFNPDLFNFTKVDSKEILFELCPERETLQSDKTADSIPAATKHHCMIINTSPLEYCHVLLVPSRFQCLPQCLTEDALHLALDTILLSAHRGFILGMNSLCALASVNHQHFHGYYLEYELPVCKAVARHVIGPCYELLDWPVRGFAFQLKGHTVKKTARMVYLVACILQRKEIAHNIVLTRGDELDQPVQRQTVRIVLWPRQSWTGSKSEIAGASSSAFNTAICEMSGHLPIFDKDCFETITEEQAVSTIKQASLSTAEFDDLKNEVRNIFQESS